MNDPEVTLKDTILYTNWNLSGDLDKEEITFTRSQWRAESGGALEKPRIVVDHTRANREQEVDDLFVYDAEVIVYQWATGSTGSAITTAKDAKWDMIEEIKRIVKLYDVGGSKSLPSDWKSMKVMSFTNLDSNLARPLLAESIVIRIRLNWSPS